MRSAQRISFLFLIILFFLFIFVPDKSYAVSAFTDVTSASGLTGPLSASERGASWIDIDNDGDLDLYLIYYSANNRLYLNDGDGTFTEDTSGSIYGLSDGTELHWGATWFDIDNDKDFDLYLSVLASSNNSLYINNGPGQAFTQDTAGTYGLNISSGTRGYSLPFDIDEDGDLDLFIYSTAGSKMMINNGVGTAFTEDTNYGLDAITDSQSAILVDINADGRMDLYIVSYASTNKLWINNGPGNAFTESGATYGLDHEASSSHASAAVSDINNDGKIDLYLNNFIPLSGVQNILYLNNGIGQAFTDASSTYGANSSASASTYSSNWIDIDNDTDFDLYITQANSSSAYPNKLFINNGAGTSFTESASSYGVDNSATRHLDATWVDYDGDGDLDLYVAREGSQANYLFNNPGQGNKYLEVLVKDADGYHQYNARVEIDIDGNGDFSTSGGYVMQYQTTSSRGGVGQYLNSIDPSSVFFGLGSSNECKYDVRVYLPGTSPTTGTPDFSYTDVCPNQSFTTGTGSPSTLISTDNNSPNNSYGNTDFEIVSFSGGLDRTAKRGSEYMTNDGTPIVRTSKNKPKIKFEKIEDDRSGMDYYQLRLTDTHKGTNRKSGSDYTWIDSIPDASPGGSNIRIRDGFTIKYEIGESNEHMEIKIEDGEYRLDGGNYYLKVRAYDKAGHHTDSEEILVMIGDEYGDGSSGSAAQVTLKSIGTIPYTEVYSTYYYASNLLTLTGEANGTVNLRVDDQEVQTIEASGLFKMNQSISTGRHAIELNNIQFNIVADPTRAAFPESLR